MHQKGEKAINDNYIKEAVEELNDYFGVKEPISGSDICSLVREEKIKEASEKIARVLGLPINVNLKFTSEFQTKKVARNSKTIKGERSEGIGAQVEIPGDLPPYGSSSLENFIVNVKVGKKMPQLSESLVLILAHELSHVLLASCQHKKSNNETYTDLTAMLLGFLEIFSKGRKSMKVFHDSINRKVERTTTFSTLSDIQFNTAYEHIRKILREKRKRKQVLQKKTKQFEGKINEFKEIQNKVELYKGKSPERSNKQVSQDKLRRLSGFYRPSYKEEKEQVIKENTKKLEEIRSFRKNLSHYTKNKMQTLADYISFLKDRCSIIESELEAMKEDLKLLQSTLSWSRRIQIFISEIF